MDRFTAPSITDWPLPPLPISSLVNVSRESKRHCRILPAGIVDLNLTQMADAAANHEKHVRRKFREEQARKKLHEEQSRMRFHEEHSKKLDYEKVEFTEHEFEKGAFGCKKGEKKRKRKQEHLERKKIRVVEPSSFDEMLESVDALLTSLESPVARTIKREKAPDALAMSEHEYTSSPMTEVIEIAEFNDTLESADMLASSLKSPVVRNIETQTTSHAIAISHTSSAPTEIIEIAELDAYETAIPRPSTPTTKTDCKSALADYRKKGKDIATRKENIITPPPAHTVINFITPLHSNPPTSNERAFARKLRNEHHAHRVAGLGSHELTFPISDEVIEHDSEEGCAKKKKKTKKTKLSFSKAVSKGFKEIFGEESCFG